MGHSGGGREGETNNNNNNQSSSSNNADLSLTVTSLLKGANWRGGGGDAGWRWRGVCPKQLQEGSRSLAHPFQSVSRSLTFPLSDDLILCCQTRDFYCEMTVKLNGYCQCWFLTQRENNNSLAQGGYAIISQSLNTPNYFQPGIKLYLYSVHQNNKSYAG